MKFGDISRGDQGRAESQSLESLEAKIRENPARTEILNSLRQDMAAMVKTGDKNYDDLIAGRVRSADQLVPAFRVDKQGKPILNFGLRKTEGQGYSEILFADTGQGKLDEINQRAWEQVSKHQPTSAEQFKKDLFAHQILSLKDRIKFSQDLIDTQVAAHGRGGADNSEPARFRGLSELKNALESELNKSEDTEETA